MTTPRSHFTVVTDALTTALATLTVLALALLLAATLIAVTRRTITALHHGTPLRRALTDALHDVVIAGPLRLHEARMAAVAADLRRHATTARAPLPRATTPTDARTLPATATPDRATA